MVVCGHSLPNAYSKTLEMLSGYIAHVLTAGQGGVMLAMVRERVRIRRTAGGKAGEVEQSCVCLRHILEPRQKSSKASK